jgi:hypothetical protein
MHQPLALVIVTLLLLAGCAGTAGEDELDVPDVTVGASDGNDAAPEIPGTAVAAPNGDLWLPAPGTTWQWQLDELPLDTTVDVDVYDIDLFETAPSLVADLHADGRFAICYISVGSWEEWRPDASAFPEAVIGSAYDGWEGERWLDIRAIDALAHVMLPRLDMCRDKGFDGVEPDNIDGYDNETGFDLTYDDQLRFNRWLADEAHARGLSIGLKNDADQVDDLLGHFDWALTEDCFDEGWCGDVSAFVESGRAVFAAEYTDTGITLDSICAAAGPLRIDAILKNRELDRFVEAC